MKPILTLIFLIPMLVFGQVVQTVGVGQTAIITMGNNDYVTPFDVPGKVTSKSGVLIADEVVYVPATAPNDTIYTLMNARTTGKKRAILFERGSERDTVITVADDSLIFASYGSGLKPKIYGSELITGWTLQSGNIYKKHVAGGVSQLFIDNEPAAISRYPETGFATITTKTNDTVFISTDIASEATNYYRGANAVIKGAAWRIQQKEVTVSTGRTLTIIDPLTAATLTVNDEMFLINKLQWINGPGEWCRSNDTIYVWMPNSDLPANYTIRASIYENGVDINSHSYVNVKNLDIQQQKGNAIKITTGDNNLITNNTISKVLGNGVYGSSTALNNEVSYNAISNIYTIGISKEMAATNWNIHHNNISNIGFYEQLGLIQNSELTPGTAIQSLSGNADINDNVINNVGYIGIRAENGTVNIKRNYIKDVLQVLDDGAAIYAFNASYYVFDDTQITDNIIIGAIGNPDFSDQTFKQGAGIYFDGGAPGALNVTVERNTIGNATIGILSNSGNYRGIKYNTFFDCMYSLYRTVSANDTIKFNNFYATNRRDTIVYFASGTHQRFMTEAVMTNIYNNNIYVAPYTETGVFDGSTFAAWQTAAMDANSTYNGTNMVNGYTEKLIYNETSVPKIFQLNGATNVTDAFSGAAVGSNITLQPFTSKVLIGAGVGNIAE